MTDKKIEIVGAGLAGLVAGTNLARQGFDVTIYERQKQIGGRPSVRPDPAGSPFNLPLLTEFIGIDISPACQLNTEFHFCIWGKKQKMKYHKGVETYMIERGARETSLDSILLDAALNAGVSIQYNKSFDIQKDIDALPPNSIITVGLEKDGYKMLGQPEIPLYGYYARGKSNKKEPEVCLYFDSYTKDYGFTSNINGCSFAFLIGTSGRVSPDAPERFRKQIEKTCDYRLKTWQTFDETVLPHASPTSPRLFYKNKILAGTVTGMMDPVLYFGMLSAMISGKIAATAVTNRRLAEKQFKTSLAKYKRAWWMKYAINHSPDIMRRTAFNMVIPFFNAAPPFFLKHFWTILVPGYNVYG